MNLKKKSGSKPPKSLSDSGEQPFEGLKSTLDAAKCYHVHGFSPVPLLPNSKQPASKWKAVEYDPEAEPGPFAGDRGVALKLGKKHGGLVDLDLDCKEARRLASYFLPDTQCVYGRKSARASHWSFRTKSAVKTKKFQAKIDRETVVLVEVRGEKHIATFPPSGHPSGKKLRFESGRAGLPTAVDADDLGRRAGCLAAAALMARVWPKLKGARQDVAMALAGGMLRGGCDPKYAKEFILRVAQAAGDEEATKRAEAVHHTDQKISSVQQVTGWPRLSELLGTSGGDIVSKCREWLGIGATGTSLGQGAPAKAALKVTPADEIAPQKVTWLWPGMIPKSALAIIDGDPGVGKSTICIDLAARVSSGGTMPDGTTCAPGTALILSAEDNPATTIVPRLIAAGADLSRVRIVDSETEVAGHVARMVSLPDDVASLQREIDACAADLVVVDPLVAFLGRKISVNKDQEVRQALSPLKTLAEDTGVTILVVRHLNKKEGMPAIYRGGGSIGVVGAARSALLASPSPDDPDVRVLAVVKSNLGKGSQAWAYRVAGKHSAPDDSEEWEAAAVEWIGPSSVKAAQLVSETSTQKSTAREKAAEFLKVALAKGEMSASEVKALAKCHGHAGKTVDRAAKDINVMTQQLHEGGKITGWTWSLPESCATKPQISGKEIGHDNSKRPRKARFTRLPRFC
ncbi:MAG TPA: AAA family ATPase [Methyloceanibacter sp.]|nr:AAA family ATPase [Methyloceanibacter sp.]